MSRWRLVVAVTAVLGLSAGATAVWLAQRGSDDPGDGITVVGPGGGAPEPVVVVLGTGRPVAFEFAGTEHEVALVELVGRSAHLRLASSPVDLVLTDGVTTGVDLTGDTVPDANITLEVEGDGGPSVVFAVPPPDVWDETGFAAEGLLRPAHTVSSSGTHTTQLSLVEEQGGTLATFYLAMDRTLRWQRNAADGGFVDAPVFGAGAVPRPFGDEPVVATSVVGIDGGFLAAQAVDGHGVALQQLDPGMRLTAPPLVFDTLAWPALAATDDGLLLAAQEGSAIALIELTTGPTGPVAGRWTTVTSPGGSASDRYPQLAVDGDLGVLLYERKPRSGSASLRAAMLSVESGAVERDVLVTAAWYPSGRQASAPGPTVAVDGGDATVFWRRSVSGRVRLFLSRLSLSSGTVDPVVDGQTRTAATDDLFGHGGGYRLVRVDGATVLLSLDALHAVEPRVDGLSTAARFVLHDVLDDGIAGEPVVLDGGLPVRADLLVELGAYAQNPDLAVAGQPVVIEGAVTNRGQRPATASTIEVTVDGTPVANVPLATVAPQRTLRFAVDWTPPIDFAARTAPVECRVSTTAPQYTLDNDGASFALQVRQTGIISGWLADVSRDLTRQGDWLPGIPGATVTLGSGEQVLTDAGGFFRIEDVPFGSTTVSASKDGFKPATGEVSVTRDRPFAFVRMLTDDHGVLVVRAVDTEGAAMTGVALQMVGGPLSHTGADGTVVFDLPAGNYDFIAAKPGFWAVGPESFEVVFDQERTSQVVLEPAVEGIVRGRVIGARGQAVPDATVTITPASPEVAPVTLPVDAEGRFADVRLPAAPVASYSITATSPSESGTGRWDLALHGGEIRSDTLVVAPEAAGLGELQATSAVEGYTSWMIKAEWPGFLELPSAAMYVWYGNYAVRVSAEYWGGTHELVALDVSVEGNSYESHATKSEVDFSAMRGTYGELFETTKFSDEHLDSAVDLFEILTTETDQYLSGIVDTVLDVGGDVVDLVTGGTADDWVITGQGPELLTWSEARDDFAVSADLDTSSVAGMARSSFDIAASVPRGFAIPVVIGGSSEQLTSVRVDQVDVVDVETREVLWSSGEDQWFSWSSPGPGNLTTERYEIDEAGIDARDVAVYVWLRVGKVYPNELGGEGGNPTVYGTGFEQRAEQVVLFRPDNQTMIARIAPGDPYRHPELLHLPG